MIQIALIAVSIGLVVLGVKGLTSSGLALTKNKSLTGTPAKVVGVCCILGGFALIPMVFLMIWLMSK